MMKLRKWHKYQTNNKAKETNLKIKLKKQIKKNKTNAKNNNNWL